MRYAGIIYDDTAAAPGLCLSFFVQGCPLHCPGCHNQETWDPNGGHEFNDAIMQRIINKLNANGIDRSLCVMGGEPLAPYNLDLTLKVISEVKKIYPEKAIYLWTGYTYEQIQKRSLEDDRIKQILAMLTCMIDGPFVQELRDITLQMRGSTNQQIHYLNN